LSEDDLELERLKAKRLAEMQQNISTLTQSKALEPEKKEKPNPRNIVLKSLGFRGQEVLETAESQFPNETRIIVGQLAQLITSGELNETIDGGQLLALFRTVGLRIRMNTKINVEQDGKFVSLSEKLSKTKNFDE
jgi:DNA-binding TFAR19-related protein (PDSD5 family)